MPVNSSAPAGKKLPLADEREYAEKFSAVIEDLNMSRLAKATGRSIETVKAWRARRAFANGASLINAAKNFPAVKTWLLQQIESDPVAEVSGDVTRLLSAVDRLSTQQSPEGELARALLREMHKPRGTP
jgi:hypothetical protein